METDPFLQPEPRKKAALWSVALLPVGLYFKIITSVNFYIPFFFNFYIPLVNNMGFSGGSEVRNLPAIQEMWVQSLGQEDPLEEGMATHSSILAWKNPIDSRTWQATVHGVTRESDII